MTKERHFPEDYDKTKAEFENGVELYENNLRKLQGLEAPIAIIGVHKKLVGAYRRFYEGCAHMNSSIDYAGRWVDAEQFDVSEKSKAMPWTTLPDSSRRL